MPMPWHLRKENHADIVFVVEEWKVIVKDLSFETLEYGLWDWWVCRSH